MGNVESFVNSTLMLPIEEQPGQVMNDLDPVMTLVAAAVITGAAVVASAAATYAAYNAVNG